MEDVEDVEDVEDEFADIGIAATALWRGWQNISIVLEQCLSHNPKLPRIAILPFNHLGWPQQSLPSSNVASGSERNPPGWP